MIINKIQKNKASASSSQDGFTLIELMVATTLFTIIMMMGVGSLVVSSNSAKASQKLRIAVDNVNFAMESMTRELRMGTHYYCYTSYSLADDNAVKDCTDGTVVAFNPQVVPGSVKRVAYFKTPRFLPNGNPDGTNSLQRCEIGIGCSDIVSGDVNIKELKFYVVGSSLTDKIQPSVEILIRGEVNIKNKNMIKSFTLQTMTSQRSAEK